MKKFTSIILISAICITFMCACGEISNEDVSSSETLTKIRLEPDEITVEVGDIFTINVVPTPYNAELLKEANWNEFEWKNEEKQNIVFRNDWDPNKASGWNSNIYDGTSFRALNPGITYLTLGNSSVMSNKCKVTVVEKIEEKVETTTLSPVETSIPEIANQKNSKVTVKNTLPVNLYGLSSYCKLTDVKITVNGDYATVKITAENLSSNTMCNFAYKLYDSSGVVIDSGIVYQDNVSYGERFVDEFRLRDLDGEGYSLQFTDNNI